VLYAQNNLTGEVTVGDLSIGSVAMTTSTYGLLLSNEPNLQNSVTDVFFTVHYWYYVHFANDNLSLFVLALYFENRLVIFADRYGLIL
jgi:hypothetical protein